MTLRDKILAAKDLPVEKVRVDEWDMDIYVRSMTGSERDTYESDLMENKDLPLKDRLKNMRAKLVVLCTVDKDGKRVFTDNDVEAVGEKSAKALSKITDAAQVLNALSDGDVEDLAGN